MALVAQLLTEAFVLAFIGAALGLFVAGGASSVFRSLAGACRRRRDSVGLAHRVVFAGVFGGRDDLVRTPTAIRGREEFSGSLARRTAPGVGAQSAAMDACGGAK